MYLYGLLNVTFIVVAILNEEVSQLRVQTPSVGRHFLFINRPDHQRLLFEHEYPVLGNETIRPRIRLAKTLPNSTL